MWRKSGDGSEEKGERGEIEKGCCREKRGEQERGRSRRERGGEGRVKQRLYRERVVEDKRVRVEQSDVKFCHTIRQSWQNS